MNAWSFWRKPKRLKAQGQKKGWGKGVTPNTIKRCLVTEESEHSTGLVLL